MNKKNRKCLCCSTEYFYCPSCSESKNRPSWMFLFHEEKCKDVFQIVTDYNYGLLSKDHAQEKLSKYNLEDLSAFNDDIRRVLFQIIKEEPPIPEKADETVAFKPKKRTKAKQVESVGQ